MNYIINGKVHSPRDIKILAVKEGMLQTRNWSGYSMNDLKWEDCLEYLQTKSYKFKIKEYEQG